MTLLRQLNLVLQSGPGSSRWNTRLDRRVEVARQFAANDLIHWLARHATLVERATFHGGDYFAIASSSLMYTKASARASTQAGRTTSQTVPSNGVFCKSHFATRVRVQFEARGEIEEPPTTHLHSISGRPTAVRSIECVSARVFGRPLLFDDFAGATIRLRVGSVGLPLPARNEPIGAFGREVGRLPHLDAQGDGMRSFSGDDPRSRRGRSNHSGR